MERAKADNVKEIILALSASILGTVWEKCESVGMNGYLGKPFRSEELKQKLQELMSP